MLKILNHPYLNLDPYLPIDSMPSIIGAVADSYGLIKQNTWQKNGIS